MLGGLEGADACDSIVTDLGAKVKRAAAIGLVVALGTLGACASGGARSGAGPAEAPLVLVYLKSGPTSGTGTKEARAEIFRGHMSNMQRLSDEGRLIIAGPFSKPRDKSWRGLFVMDVPTEAQALALGASDPGVIAGEFVLEARALRASPDLRETLRLERELKARTADAPKPKPGEPPANIRAYTLVHTPDIHAAVRAIEDAQIAAHDGARDGASVGAAAPSGATAEGGAPRIVWAARFAEGDGGVLALSVADADKARAWLTAIGAPGEVDGWWSTTSLMDLPAPARRIAR